MTKHDLKELAAMGAELGAAKAENEKLRGLLERIRTTCCQVRDAQDLDTAPGLSAAESLHEQIEKLDAALSQQPEPTDTYTAVDMATAAAQGFRDGQAAMEQAAAQDEREAFEAHMRLGGYSNPEKRADGSYVSSAMELWWQGWKARAARRAQTEQQPKEEIPKPDGWVAAGRFFTDRDEAIAAAEKTPCVDVYLRPSLLTILARSAERQSVAEELARLLSQANCDIRQLNAAAPIAQTAPQPEQSGLDPHAIAQQVREALDRQACPNAWMVIAYEATVTALSATPSPAKRGDA
ncbi:MAG: hypothetical protein CVV19_00560 [Gammaproteobacteria bacterium HGW-Gammaproteobacteria-9]|nr:MAG: hypothetical protein CVV19_00560 [Gammaproteobacteria bacterium HGW-Gammaproteobacteria-9]